MALRPCRECGAQVGANAEQCPSCGALRPDASPQDLTRDRAGCLVLYVLALGLPLLLLVRACG